MAKELKDNATVSKKTQKELDKQAALVEKQSKEREAKIKKEKALGTGKAAVGVVQVVAAPGVVTKVMGATKVISGNAKAKNAEKNIDKKNEKALEKQEKKVEKSLKKDLAFKSKDEKQAIVSDFDKQTEAAKNEHHLDNDLDMNNAKASDIKEQSKTIKDNIKVDKEAEKAAEAAKKQSVHDARVKQANSTLHIDDINRNAQLQQSGMEY